MKQTILLTGSHGLIGTSLAPHLRRLGATILPVDIRAPDDPRDLRDHALMAELAARADGIIHLGAVSRVIDGQLDPANCRAVNVDATRNLLAAAAASPRKPWFIYASSREVYGQQDDFPVHEDADYRPMNVYARSKVEAEGLTNAAREAGIATSVVRFSSVYGAPGDHHTRVTPAFLRAALEGATLRVEGDEHTFDLTHVDDVTDGLMSLIGLLDTGERNLPPIHFVSGAGTTLLDLAQRAVRLGDPRASIVLAPPRSYDIYHFVGDPRRAATLLGWRATTPLDTGLARLAADLAGATIRA